MRRSEPKELTATDIATSRHAQRRLCEQQRRPAAGDFMQRSATSVISLSTERAAPPA